MGMLMLRGGCWRLRRIRSELAKDALCFRTIW